MARRERGAATSKLTGSPGPVSASLPILGHSLRRAGAVAAPYAFPSGGLAWQSAQRWSLAASMRTDAGSAVAAGVVDMKPTDPIEGVLISQIVTANEAALEFYRRGWTNTAAGYFDAGTKYLQLADKSSRTVALLTERPDQHPIRSLRSSLRNGTE
jgi:hypothetical protein